MEVLLRCQTLLASVLSLRHAYGESVKFLAHPDLAGKARVRLRDRGEAQHRSFLRSVLRQTRLVEPFRFNIDVAGGGGAFSAAGGLNARHVVVDRAAHHRGTDGDLDAVFGAVEFDVRDFRHASLPGCAAATT